MKFSTDRFNIPISLSPSELTNRLSEQTQSSWNFMMKPTTKKFIGTVTSQGFKVISSSFPIGGVCVMEGKLTGDERQIQLKTSVNRAFRILYVVWLVGMFTLNLVGMIISRITEISTWIRASVIFIIVAILFRLLIHGIYVLSRNSSVKRLKEHLK
jgi:VIT1/CCC1 family predicted Fe2+/Mn2+ transporter